MGMTTIEVTLAVGKSQYNKDLIGLYTGPGIKVEEL